MSELKIAIKGGRTEFRPGDLVAGVAGWSLEKPAERVEVRLFWFTRGKGTEDAEVVETVRFDDPQISEARPFQFILPAEPYSFSGKLISLIWGLEVVAVPSDESARVEITMSPTGREVILGV